MSISERESLLSYISDAHKDVYGYRPSSYNYEIWNNIPIDLLERVANVFSDRVAETIKEDDAFTKFQIGRFENRIADMISSLNIDRETAIRWDRQSYDDPQIENDVDYYLWTNGLPYDYDLNLRS